jgi:hypothetical protein
MELAGNTDIVRAAYRIWIVYCMVWVRMLIDKLVQTIA